MTKSPFELTIAPFPLGGRVSAIREDVEILVGSNSADRLTRFRLRQRQLEYVDKILLPPGLCVSVSATESVRDVLTLFSSPLVTFLQFYSQAVEPKELFRRNIF